MPGRKSTEAKAIDAAVQDVQKKPHGGGMPKGHKTAKTLGKEEAKEILRQMVMARLGPIVNAQIASAEGISHFMLRDPATGQWMRLTDPDQIQAALNAEGAAEGSTYHIFTKDPHNPAAVDLFNRAMGKPVEEIDASVNGALVIRWKTSE